MKRILVLLTALAMLVVCSACSNDGGSSSSGNSPAANSALTEQPSPAASVAAGDMMTFGHYEQDNNPGNGPEAIEWLVLDVQDGKALLLSRYGLEAKPYNTDWVQITWEDCTLRSWLNSDFMNQAFTPEEQSAILLTEVDNSDVQGFDWTTMGGDKTTGGNNTQDKVFLLSYAEANKYLGVQHMETEGAEQNLNSRAAATKHAIRNGAWTSDEYKTADGAPSVLWWLRSPGHYQGNAAGVTFGLRSTYVDLADGGVRPAFWLDLES